MTGADVNVDKLATELAAYQGSRLWAVTDPGSVAEWVFSDPDDFEQFEALPDAAAALDQMRAAFRSESNEDWLEASGLAFAGTAVRATVPEVARTGGKYWALTVERDAVYKWVRLTVGDSETAIVAWAPDRLFIQLRLAASPIKEALKSGSLSSSEMIDLGIFKGTDYLGSFARDAVRYHCDDVNAAMWFLNQPAVLRAARLMNARLAAAAERLPRTAQNNPALVARAWAAAEVWYFDPEVELPTYPGEDLRDALEVSPTGFDRPYRGKPAEGNYSDVQATSPAARERAAAEHDALCRQLIAHLANVGIDAGELTNPLVDVAWRDRHRRQVIAEVKSCLDGNDADQLRLGLGQVLEYRQRLADAGGTADAILLVTRVKDPIWYEICRGVDVRLLAGDEEASWDLGR